MTKSAAQPIPALAAKLLPSAMAVRKAKVDLGKGEKEFAKIYDELTKALDDGDDKALAVLADDGRIYIFGDVDDARSELDDDEPFSLPFIDGRTVRLTVDADQLFRPSGPATHASPAPPVDLPAKAAAKKSARRSPGGASVVQPRR